MPYLKQYKHLGECAISVNGERCDTRETPIPIKNNAVSSTICVFRGIRDLVKSARVRHISKSIHIYLKIYMYNTFTIYKNICVFASKRATHIFIYETTALL